MPLVSEHRIAFGNGTSALYAALRALGVERSFVAVQPNVCPNVIVAIFATSNRPFFVDVEADRCGISPRHLDAILPKVSAVIAVHSYGIPCLIERIVASSRKHKVPVIEDCAQAEGATYHRRRVGDFGDVAVFSYGAGKILSLAGGGGMAVTKDSRVAGRLERVREQLPDRVPEEAAERLGRYFKSLYNRHYPDRLQRHRAATSRYFKKAAKSLLAAPREELDREIKLAKKRLPRVIAVRKRNAEIYSRELVGQPGIRICRLPEGSVPWRFNLRMRHALRQHVLKALLGMGTNVSSWYPDMRRFLAKASYASSAAPESVGLDETILNLWLDEGTSEDAIMKTTRRVKQALRAIRNSG